MNEEKEEIQPVNLDLMKYQEELCKEMHLPSPYAMQVLKKVCKEFVDSGFAPECFRANPAAVFMAAMRGRELGLSPAESVFETFWAAPGGRLGLYANKMLDLMHRGGVKTDFSVLTAQECKLVCTPPGEHKSYTAEFHIEEAKRAGLVKPGSNWEKWPLDMNKARAIARAYRALAGTFQGSGNFYSMEELDDMENPVSTTAPPSDSDRIRGERLAAQAVEAEFQPGRRPKIVEIKQEKPNGAPTESPAPDTPPQPVKTPPGVEGPALWTNKAWVRTQIEAVKGTMVNLGETKHKAGILVNQFVRGYLGLKEIPQEPQLWEKPILALNKILGNPELDDFKNLSNDPEIIGAKAANRIIRHPAEDYFDKLGWNEETRAKARLVYTMLGFEDARKFFDDYIIGSCHLDQINEDQTIAFLRITARIRDCTDLYELHRQFNLQYDDVLREIEVQFAQRIEDISPTELSKAIKKTLTIFVSQKLNASLKGEETGELPWLG